MTALAYDEAYGEAVARRRAQILELVARAAGESGRDPAEVTVCAVSKTVDVGQVVAARVAGYRAFAENRPQELSRKLAALRDDPAFAGVAWHMIGNLQENKINRVLGDGVALIQSVSSSALAQAVSKRACARGLVQPVLLEVNVSGEQSKSGMTPRQLEECCAAICDLPGIDVRGLMTMAPQGDPVAARATFAGLSDLRSRLRSAVGSREALPELSMGMSEDFQEAVRQGATIIRLGRVAFDPDFPLV